MRFDNIPLWVSIIVFLSLFLILLIFITRFYIQKTVSKKIEQARKKESYDQSLVQKLQAIVIRISQKGEIILINDYSLALLGQSRAKIMECNVFDLGILPDGLCADCIQDIMNLPASGKTSYIEKADSKQYFQWSFTRVKSEAAENIVCLGLDVSERIEMESALLESDKKFTAFMNNMPAYALIKDSKGQLLYANKVIRELFKEPLENLQVEDFKFDEDVLSKDTEAERRILFEGSAKEIVEYEALFPGEKQVRKIHQIYFPINITRNEMWLGVIALDNTEQIAREELLNHAHKMQVIGELAGGIAHDFNNQLTGIMGYADLLSHSISDERSEKYAQKLKDAVERASELTAQLLSFSRKGKKENRGLNINTVIEDLIGLLSHSLNKQISIYFNVKAENPVIQGDANLIQNALLNISINARDAMKDKGKLSFTTQNIYVDKEMCALQGYALEPGPFLKITVEDTGSGIPEEIKNKIFEPFFTTKEEGMGTGMGLAMVYGTMQDHKGNITLESSENKGCVFSLYFPQNKSVNEDLPEVRKVLEEEASYKIAVVDDETMIRDFLNISLTKKGHVLNLFKDGNSFLKSLSDERRDYDLIILDMIMPGMSGIECYRELIKTHPDMRVLLSSGYSKKEDVQEIMENPNVLYIQKPYNIDELSKEIFKLMAGFNGS